MNLSNTSFQQVAVSSLSEVTAPTFQTPLRNVSAYTYELVTVTLPPIIENPKYGEVSVALSCPFCQLFQIPEFIQLYPGANVIVIHALHAADVGSYPLEITLTNGYFKSTNYTLNVQILDSSKKRRVGP